MKRHLAIILLAALMGVMAIGGISLAQADKDRAGVPAERQAGASGYHLEGAGRQVQGVARCGAYRLEAPAGVAGGGTPCCCTYMPCIPRNTPYLAV